MERRRPLDGAKVRRLREDMEEMPTQDMVAKATGISVQTISAIENGKRPNAARGTIFALAEYLGIKPSELLKSDPKSFTRSPEADADQSSFGTG